MSYSPSSSSSYYTKSSELAMEELTREPIVLDEYKIYFSTLWSPPPKKYTNHGNQADDHGYAYSNGGMRNHQGPSHREQYYSQPHRHYTARGEEDVDVEAEEFIAMKHKNFELSKWMSRG